MRFFYKAISNGEMITGIIQSQNKFTAIANLEERGLDIIILNRCYFLNSIFIDKNKQLADWFKNLNNLLKIGFPLFNALRILEVSANNLYIAYVTGEICNSLQEGKKLELCLREYDQLFPHFAISTIALAEQIGALQIICKNLAEYYMEIHNHNKAVRASIIYPALMFVSFIIMISLFFVYVFRYLWEVLGMNNPTVLTELSWIIHISDNYNLYLCFTCIGLGILSVLCRIFWNKICFFIPFIGIYYKNREWSQMFFTLHMYLDSGFSLNQAVALMKNMNFMNIKMYLLCGYTLSASLKKAQAPTDICKIIHLYEQANNLVGGCQEISTFYKNLALTNLQQLQKIIYPFSVVSISIGLLTFVYYVLSPIYSAILFLE